MGQLQDESSPCVAPLKPQWWTSMLFWAPSTELGILAAGSNARKSAQLCVPSCPLWLMPFEKGSKETVARMNTWNRPQKIAADQLINILPDQLSRFLQAV